MHDALLVLNAGSSSLKFSAFADRSPAELVVRGQVEGIPEQPRFAATDAAGNRGDRAFDGRGGGAWLGHEVGCLAARVELRSPGRMG